MGEITFTDDPPYWLPPAQSAEVRALDTIVELTLRVSVPDKRPEPLPIRIQLPLSVAQHLRGQFQAVVSIAERAARRQRET